MTKTIMGNFDYKRYIGLKRAYKQALAENREMFVYEDIEYLTSFAKYLLEFLEMNQNNL